MLLQLLFFELAFAPVLSERPRRPNRLRELLRPNAAGPLELLSGWQAWPSEQKMKVVYGVFTSPLPKYAEQMAAVAETWANDVPPQKLLVVGVNGTVPGVTYKQAPMCKDGHVNNAGISCKEATVLTTGYHLGADWVVVVGSDNYVFTKNFEQRLETEDPNKAQILAIWGCGDGQYCEDHQNGLCGGGGYAISRAALDKMVGKEADAAQKFIQESMTTARTVGGGWSDQVTSCIARRHGVEEVELTGLYGWKLCDGGSMECPFKENRYRHKILGEDPPVLTFHYVDPQMMRSIHQMHKDADAGLAVLGTKSVSKALSPPLPHDWESGWSDKYNHKYYFNRWTGESTWSRPHATASFLSTSSSSSRHAFSYDFQRKAYIEMMDKELAAHRVETSDADSVVPGHN